MNLLYRTHELDWDESKHPRDPAGTSTGGQFTGDGGGDRDTGGGRAPKLPSSNRPDPYKGRRSGDTYKGAKVYDNRDDPAHFAAHGKLKDVDHLVSGLDKRTSRKGSYYTREWATPKPNGDPDKHVYADNAGRIHVSDYGRLEKDPHQETYSLAQHRDEGGAGGGKSKHPGEGYSKHATVDANGVIHTTKVEDAVRALYEGRKVELKQPKQVSTLIHKLGEEAKRWQEQGQDAPRFNLCDVSVAGTNLFCAESKGIPRAEMPQMDKKQTARFLELLEKKGFRVEKDDEYAANLRATQDQLKGSQVAANMDRLEKEGEKGAPRIVISKDDYILDGHHRWAAKIGLDAANNKLRDDLKMKVSRVDIDIITLVNLANEFTGGKGAKTASFEDELLYRRFDPPPF